MAHRTTNPKTAFFGDMRETRRTVSTLSRKQALSVDAWNAEFGDERMPHRTRDVYAELAARGWQWKNNVWIRLTPLAADAATAGENSEQATDAAPLKSNG